MRGEVIMEYILNYETKTATLKYKDPAKLEAGVAELQSYMEEFLDKEEISKWNVNYELVQDEQRTYIEPDEA